MAATYKGECGLAVLTCCEIDTYGTNPSGSPTRVGLYTLGRVDNFQEREAIVPWFSEVRDKQSLQYHC